MTRESVKVLQECIDLQNKKSQDYQNPNSNVVQAMHYRRGVDSIHDVMQGKMYRAQSLLESGSAANFESLEDTYKDLINYASFAISYMRGKMEGQDPTRDMFNKKKVDLRRVYMPSRKVDHLDEHEVAKLWKK
ncbi:Clostridium phage phiCTP1, Gp74 [uncultured Caudovirales phage]|uniref:Clostridium phage phiCTP1, Gp74 n=1 Tax=uncultured Caudovirales phage TaxID=2100421 RepID=A0A6J7WTZ9_9CAUD|nr:Clostridium phage phiCTP1, Gp74 [uncultured Caudovirales phage]